MRGFILYCSGSLIFYRIDIQNIEFTEGIAQICGRCIQVYTTRIGRFVINYLELFRNFLCSHGPCTPVYRCSVVIPSQKTLCFKKLFIQQKLLHRGGCSVLYSSCVQYVFGTGFPCSLAVLSPLHCGEGIIGRHPTQCRPGNHAGRL